LLAVDRVNRALRQERFMSDESGSDEYRISDDESWSQIDQPLASALEAAL